MRRKRTSLVVGLALLICLLVFSVVSLDLTGAWFTSESDPTEHEVSIGNLAAEIILAGEIAVADLLPGGRGPVLSLTVSNVGDAAFEYSFIVSGEPGDNVLWTGDSGDDGLLVEFVTDIGGATVERTVPLNQLAVALNNFYAGQLNAGENSQPVFFRVHLPWEAGNAYMGQATVISISVFAEQVQ